MAVIYLLLFASLKNTRNKSAKYIKQKMQVALRLMKITENFLHNNYCNIDAISRHLTTAGLLCVCFFFFIFFILCTYLSGVFHLPRDR